MSQGIGGVGGSGSVSGVGSLGTCTSVNFIFAKLQMELAASAKDSALGYIKQIEGAQAEQKEVADMLKRCRELQNQAKDSGGCTEMPADVREFMDKNNLLGYVIYCPRATLVSVCIPDWMAEFAPCVYELYWPMNSCT